MIPTKRNLHEASLPSDPTQRDPNRRISFPPAVGTDDAAARLSRVLRNDPGMGVIRHADAGYEIAQDTQQKYGLDFKERLK